MVKKKKRKIKSCLRVRQAVRQLRELETGQSLHSTFPPFCRLQNLHRDAESSQFDKTESVLSSATEMKVN